MSTYVVLLRGVNVGGKNLLPMRELRTILEENGFKKVKTYIQSGNIILINDTAPDAAIRNLIERHFSFVANVMALSEEEFFRSIENNPYQEYLGKFVHFFFCIGNPEFDEAKLLEFASATESFCLSERVFYLHAPEGIGRSKLAAKIEACLGVPVTARNLNTVNKLKTMLEPE